MLFSYTVCVPKWLLEDVSDENYEVVISGDYRSAWLPRKRIEKIIIQILMRKYISALDVGTKNEYTSTVVKIRIQDQRMSACRPFISATAHQPIHFSTFSTFWYARAPLRARAACVAHRLTFSPIIFMARTILSTSPPNLSPIINYILSGTFRFTTPHIHGFAHNTWLE